LFSTLIVFAEGPAKSNAPVLAPDTVLFQNESVASMGSDDLEKYGIKTPLYKKLKWGGILGFNESSNGFNSLDKPAILSNPEFGPVFGPTLEAPFSRTFGARIEILYSQNVFTGESDASETPYLYIDHLTYVDVPLEIIITPIRKFNIFFGGDYSLLLRNKYDYVQTPITQNQAQVCQNPNTKSHYFGGLFGADFTLYNITLGCRVTCGVPNNNYANPQNTAIVQISLGYAFSMEN
jgi:hypothetical protein